MYLFPDTKNNCFIITFEWKFYIYIRSGSSRESAILHVPTVAQKGQTQTLALESPFCVFRGLILHAWKKRVRRGHDLQPHCSSDATETCTVSSFCVPAHTWATQQPLPKPHSLLQSDKTEAQNQQPCPTVSNRSQNPARLKPEMKGIKSRTDLANKDISPNVNSMPLQALGANTVSFH